VSQKPIDHRTPRAVTEDIASAKVHYNQGVSSVAPDDRARYAGLLFEIEELENLVQSRDTNDPSRARKLLAEAREDLALVENIRL